LSKLPLVPITIYLESYWPGHVEEYDRITKAGATFCDTFGPQDLVYGYSEFLGYYMSHKVFGPKKTKQAAGFVTSGLALWLAMKDYVTTVQSAVQTSKRASKELSRLSRIISKSGELSPAELGYRRDPGPNQSKVAIPGSGEVSA